MACRQVSNKNISLRIVNLNVLAFFELDQINHPKTNAVNKFILLHISIQKKYSQFRWQRPHLLAHVKAATWFMVSAIHLVRPSRCLTSVQIYQSSNLQIRPQMALYLLILKCLLCSYWTSSWKMIQLSRRILVFWCSNSLRHQPGPYCSHSKIVKPFCFYSYHSKKMQHHQLFYSSNLVTDRLL